VLTAEHHELGERDPLNKQKGAIRSKGAKSALKFVAERWPWLTSGCQTSAEAPAA
jgi:hypothetical protein